MIKKINQRPSIVDNVLFELECPGADGLLAADPYSIESIVIYHIERDFGKINDKSYEMKHYDMALEKDVADARKMVHDDPSPENVNKLSIAKMRLDAAVIKHNFYFNEARPVYTLGSKETPAFVAADPTKSLIKAVVKNENGHEQFGRFKFEWDATGNREGDYFISWSWRMTEGQPLLASHQIFYLESVKGKNTYLPVRYTQENKYEILLDRYMPNMYRYKIKTDDLTPYVLGKLHKCIASGFTQLEDIANQLMDIYDANSTHEAILPLLSNMFNLKLKSNDSTLWRRQIKQAVPLYKRKGTASALTEALDQAGIKLLKLTKLWQIASEYIWTDGFVNDGTNSIVGTLSRMPLNIDDVEIKMKASDSDELLSVPKELVKFSREHPGDNFLVTWHGNLVKPPVSMYEGDLILIKYQIKPIPPERHSLENYIQSLPLADQRDPIKQKYPFKNWNIHLLEEDDPLFDTIINSRHPFYNPVVYGKVRTTFLYSEKVYNMDTYNGSLRDSDNPCDIDKDFLDTCSYCQSSKFNVDLEIEDLSSDRIDEAREIIREYAPFHAMLNSLNVSSVINEFVSPVETIEALIDNKSSDIKDNITPQESITYSIEWKDGKKEEIAI